MQRFAFLAVLPLLGSCGLIPLPEVKANNFYFVNFVADVKPSEVVYMDANQIDFLRTPQLPYRGVTVDAELTYWGEDPEQHVEFFAAAFRPQCTVVQPPPQLVNYTGALRCAGPTGGQVIGEAILKRGQTQPIHFASAELDKAAQNSVLYLGIRQLSGKQSERDYVSVEQIRIRGRL